MFVQRIDSMYDVRFRDITIDSGSDTLRFSVKDDVAGSDDNFKELNDVNALNIVNSLNKHIDVVNADVINEDICKSDRDLNKNMLAAIESDNVKRDNEEILDYLTTIVHDCSRDDSERARSRLTSEDISDDASIFKFERDNQDTDDSMSDSGVFIDEGSGQDKAIAGGLTNEKESAGMQAIVNADSDVKLTELNGHNKNDNDMERTNDFVGPLGYNSVRTTSNATSPIRQRAMSAEHLFDDNGWIVTAEELELPNSNNSNVTQSSANHVPNTEYMIGEGSKCHQQKESSIVWAHGPLISVDEDMTKQNNYGSDITNNGKRNSLKTDNDCINTGNDLNILAGEVNKRKYTNIENSKQTSERSEDTEFKQTTLLESNLTCDESSDDDISFSKDEPDEEIQKNDNVNHSLSENVTHSDKKTSVGANPIPMQMVTTIFCVSVLCYGVLTNLFLP